MSAPTSLFHLSGFFPKLFLSCLTTIILRIWYGSVQGPHYLSLGLRSIYMSSLSATTTLSVDDVVTTPSGGLRRVAQLDNSRCLLMTPACSVRDTGVRPSGFLFSSPPHLIAATDCIFRQRTQRASMVVSKGQSLCHLINIE